MNELYQRLGVSPSATQDELKKAYRKLAKQYHPDVNVGNAQAEVRFREIQEAYDILKDTQKRKEYDKRQQQNTQQSQKKQQQNTNRASAQQKRPIDFSQMGQSFSQFFGFDPNTGEITDESKISGKGKNPLDTSDIFERFMGFKG